MQVEDTQVLMMLAGEAERLFEKIGAHYEDADSAPDAVAEFIVACRDAALAEPEMATPTLTSVDKAAVKEQRRKARNKRKAQRKVRKANR